MRVPLPARLPGDRNRQLNNKIGPSPTSKVALVMSVPGLISDVVVRRMLPLARRGAVIQWAPSRVTRGRRRRIWPRATMW